MTRTIQVHLCFLMDCTGSMQPWITDARSQIRTMITDTQQEFPNTEFHVGFMGYRDYGDSEQYIEIPFTRNMDDLLARIGQIHAEGGNDITEDVAGGLARVRLMFHDVPNDSVRHIIHIADAPPHGMQFHAPFESDRYPNGDPQGLDILQIVRDISQSIEYTFVKIDESTDTMLEQFHNVWMTPTRFRVVDLSSLVQNPPPLRRPAVPGGEPDVRSPLGRIITTLVSDSVRDYNASQET